MNVVEASSPLACNSSTVLLSETYAPVVGVNAPVNLAAPLLILTSSICPLNASAGDA